MPNTILTVSQITRKAQMILHAKLPFISNINKQYDSSFAQEGAKIGDTLRVRMPNEYVVRTGITMSSQDTTEVKVDLPVSTVKGVDLSFTSQDLALSLDDFSDRILEPAISVLATNIESDAFTNLYKKVWNLVDGDAAAFAFSHLSSARQMLTENIAPPSKRTAVLTPTHATKYMNDTKGLFHASENIVDQYVEGIIGKTQGFNVFESTVLGSHTTGTALKTTTYTINGAVTTNGSTTATVATGSTTFKAGDVFTVANCFSVHPETKQSTGNLQQFVVAADYAGGAGSLSFTPAIYTTTGRQNVTAGGMPTGSAIVKVGAGNGESLTNSLAFYRDAFTFATADLPLPKGVDFAHREVMDGISMSIVRDFSITDRSFPCRVDVLYGYAALRPQLACRIHADA